MKLDLATILESKRAVRRRLASLPIAEKLRMLDDLRRRQISLREAGARVRRRMPPVPSDATSGQEHGGGSK